MTMIDAPTPPDALDGATARRHRGVLGLLLGALGEELAGSYMAVRRSEWEAYSAGDDAFEQQGHFEKY